jgi:hypothetical protein
VLSGRLPFISTFKYVACFAVAASLSACNSSSSGGGETSTPRVTQASCGVNDTPETGVQGDIPREDQDSGRAALGYNCGLSPVYQFETAGAVQGYDHCVYIRPSVLSGGLPIAPSTPSQVEVWNVSNPVSPVLVKVIEIAGASGAGGTSETMRVVANENNPDIPPLLGSGSGIYDISDCENPVHKGDIAWPASVPWPAGLSHDIRISPSGDKVSASIGVVLADISDLDKPENWTATNYSCDVASQFTSLHTILGLSPIGQCELTEALALPGDTAPQLSHGPDLNASGTRLYVGNQGIPANLGDASGLLDAGGTFEDVGDTTIRILDVTTEPPTVLDQTDGPGHAVDWFRSADGREYILHSNELVFTQQASCAPHPRPSSLGWAFEAFITEVTNDTLVRRSMLELDINKPEHCQDKLLSGQGTSIAYHSVDNPFNARLAMVNFGDGFGLPSPNAISGAGLRVFDIRNPEQPQEVAYFNRGGLDHAGASYYDRASGLLYMPDSAGVRILELQPQIVSYMGLPQPTDPKYPRYPNGRAATPAE